MITDNLLCVESDPYKPTQYNPMNRRVTEEEPLTFVYDDSVKDDKLLVSILLAYHPQVFTEGFRNPNSGAAVLFEYIDHCKKNIRTFKEISLTRSALNKVWDMNYRQKVDTAYYYGANPIQNDGKLLSHRDVTILLCNPNGLILKTTLYNGKTLIEHFVSDYVGSDDNYVLKTTILKALVIGILKREGTAIMFGDIILGSSIEESMAWFNNNIEKKKFLIKEVSQKDILDADDLDTAIIESDAGNDKAEEAMKHKASYKEMQEQARKYGVKGYHILGADKLEPRLQEAIKQLDEAKSLGIEFVETLSTDKVAVLIEKRKKEVKELV